MDNPAVVLESGLVARAAGGDADAFDALVAPRLDRLYVIANRILRNSASAQDAVQQALVTAWRDLPALRDLDRFDAWVYRLLVRACYRDLRSQRRWASNVVDISEIRTNDTSTASDDRDALDRAFRRLPPDKRAVVVLHHVTGLALTEIAVILEIPEGTVRSRLHYALRELRRALADDDVLDRAEGMA